MTRLPQRTARTARRWTVAAIAIVLASLQLAGAGSAAAGSGSTLGVPATPIACGTTITRSVALTADVGSMASPCLDDPALLVDGTTGITIDLKGFTVYAARTAIELRDSTHITVKNGRVVYGLADDTNDFIYGIRDLEGDGNLISGVIARAYSDGFFPREVGFGAQSAAGFTLTKSNASGGDYGLYTVDSSVKVTSTTLSNNEGYGYYSDHDSEVYVSGTVASSNRTYNGFGFYIDTAASFTMVNSTADDNQAIGLYVYADGQGVMSVSGSSFRRNDQYGIDAEGTYRPGVSGSFLISNVASGNDLDGIYLYDPGTLTLLGNTTNGNGRSGVYGDDIDVTPGIVVAAKNVARDNADYGFHADGTVAGIGNVVYGNGSEPQCVLFTCVEAKR